VKRKASARIATLLKLAALREQNAARAFASSNAKLEQARQQADQLENYGREYEQAFRTIDTPLSASQLLNFHGFFGQLSAIQTQQEQTVQQRSTEQEAARQRWLEAYTRIQLLERIRQQRLAREQLEQEKRLQRELDDRPRFNSE
jgi:flagellar export protein FliJ